MVNKIKSEGQEKMPPTQDLFKDLSKGLRISGVYFPDGGKKRSFYWMFFLLLTANDVLMLLRQLYVIKDEINLTISLITAGNIVYDTGLMIMAIGCCYSITKYFPQFIATLEDYRRCFGELRCLKKLRYFLKVVHLIFCVLTPIMVIALHASFVFSEMWRELVFTFWPFQVDTSRQRLYFVMYATPKSLRTGGILLLLGNLFIAVCYIIITESDVIEERMKLLVRHSTGSSKTPLYVQDLDPISKSNHSCKNSSLNNTRDGQAEAMSTFTDNINKTTNIEFFNVATHPRWRPDLKDVNAAEEEEELELLRHRYECLLDLASVANDVLVNFILTAFASSLPVIGFVLYGTMKGEVKDSLMFYLAIITMNVTSAMCIILFVGSYTSVKIKKPLDHVMKINTGAASNKLILTISLLTKRLSMPSSVFHVYQLFSIDTTAVLTIFGTLLTYSLVIFQFAQGSEERLNIPCSNMTMSA